MEAWLKSFITREHLPPDFAAIASDVCKPLAEQIAALAIGPGFTVGICGAQGSGKSTLTAVIARRLEGLGLRVAVLSLDDVYLTRDERADLARRVHPMLATRGVPGTHDVGFAKTLIADLKGQGAVRMPVFDKAADDRAPPETWSEIQAPVDVILFEGWCVGARPQDTADLALPINDLERTRDPDGVWRNYLNVALAGPYCPLFEDLGHLILLAAPSFEVVAKWRGEQEAKLRARLAAEGRDPALSMSPQAVIAFIAHYERLTRHILAEMPDRADQVIWLGPDRRPI